MKKRTFLTLFITTHLIFVGAFINKQSQLIKLSYQKQTYEQTIKTLLAKKQELTNTLHAAHNHQKIKAYATNELHMEPLFLKKIKKLPLPEMKTP